MMGLGLTKTELCNHTCLHNRWIYKEIKPIIKEYIKVHNITDTADDGLWKIIQNYFNANYHLHRYRPSKDRYIFKRLHLTA